jgi:nudix-type nucleoside diphosphatase (YffH/AdpP family)
LHGFSAAESGKVSQMGVAARVRIQDVQVLADDWSVLRKTTFAFRRNDGSWQTQTRETYDRGNGAAMLLYDDARRTVVLVRQFRFPTYVNGNDDLLIEVPAGRLEEDSPAECIRAEVEQETGFRVRDVQSVLEAYMSPGSVTEKLHFFIGRYTPGDRVSTGGGQFDEGEDIEVLELSIDDALAMIASGQIRDGKTIMLLQYAALHLLPGRSVHPNSGRTALPPPS